MTYLVACIVIIAITIKAVRVYDHYMKMRRRRERMKELEARIEAWEEYLDDIDSNGEHIDDDTWLRQGRINEERLNRAMIEVSDDDTLVQCDSVEDLFRRLGITEEKDDE